MPCSSTSPTRRSIDAAVKAVEAKAGGLDILINNAALFDAAPIVEITRASYDRLFAVNVAGHAVHAAGGGPVDDRRG